MNLVLVIKGGELEARAAASRAGVRTLETVKRTAWGETVLQARESELDKVVAWFGRDHVAPFPVGALLWYGVAS